MKGLRVCWVHAPLCEKLFQGQLEAWMHFGSGEGWSNAVTTS